MCTRSSPSGSVMSNNHPNRSRRATLRRRLEKKRLHHLAVAQRHEQGTSWHTLAMNCARRCERMIKAVDAEGTPANWINY